MLRIASQMISLKNKILSFVFASITTLPVLFSVSFFVLRLIVQHTMAEALEQKALHNVTIKTNKAVWITFGKEILIEGHLFDVELYKKASDNPLDHIPPVFGRTSITYPLLNLREKFFFV
jgi:hypothetical protein